MSGIDRSGWRELHHGKGVYTPSGDHQEQINLKRGKNPPEWKLLRVDTGHKPPRARIKFEKGALIGHEYWISIKSNAVTWDPTTIKTNNISKQIVEIIDETAKILKQKKTQAFLNNATVKGIKLQLKPNCSNSVVATSIDGETLDYGQAVGEVKQSLETIHQLLTAEGEPAKGGTVETTVEKAQQKPPKIRVDLNGSKKKIEEEEEEEINNIKKEHKGEIEELKQKHQTSTNSLQLKHEEETKKLREENKSQQSLIDDLTKKDQQHQKISLENEKLRKEMGESQSKAESTQKRLKEENEKVELKNKGLQGRLKQKMTEIEHLKKANETANERIENHKKAIQKEKQTHENFKTKVKDLIEKTKKREAALSKIKGKYDQGLKKLNDDQKELDERRVDEKSAKIQESEQKISQREKDLKTNEKKVKQKIDGKMKAMQREKVKLDESKTKLESLRSQLTGREKGIKKKETELEEMKSKLKNEFRKKTEQLSGKLQIMKAELKYYKGLKEEYKKIVTQLMKNKNENEQLRKKGEEWQKKYDEQEMLSQNKSDTLVKQQQNEEKAWQKKYDEREEQIKLLENKIEVFIQQLASEKEEKTVIKKESRSMQTETVPSRETKVKKQLSKSGEKKEPKITHESKQDVLKEGFKIRKDKHLLAQKYEEDGNWKEAFKYAKEAITKLSKVKNNTKAQALLKECKQIQERAEKYLNINKQIDGYREEVVKLVGELNNVKTGKEAKESLENLKKKLNELDNSTMPLEEIEEEKSEITNTQINKRLQENQKTIQDVRKNIEKRIEYSTKEYEKAQEMEGKIKEIVSDKKRLKQYHEVLGQLERAPFYPKIDDKIAKVKRRIEHYEEALKKDAINKQKTVKDIDPEAQKKDEKFAAAKSIYESVKKYLGKIDDRKPSEALQHCSEAKQKFSEVLQTYGSIDDGIKELAQDGFKKVEELEKKYSELYKDMNGIEESIGQNYQKAEKALLQSGNVKDVENGMKVISGVKEEIPKFKEQYADKNFQEYLTAMEKQVVELKQKAEKQGKTLQKEVRDRVASFKTQKDHFESILNESLPEKNVNSWVLSKQKELKKSDHYFNDLNDDLIKIELLAGKEQPDKANPFQKQRDLAARELGLVNRFLKMNKKMEKFCEQFQKESKTADELKLDINSCNKLEEKIEIEKKLIEKHSKELIKENNSSSNWLGKLYEGIDKELENIKKELEDRSNK